jgi:hypothetical protein
MKRLSFLFAGLVALVFSLPLTLQAQEEEEPQAQMMLVYEHTVIPAMQAQYEAGIKKIRDAFKEHLPGFSFRVNMRDDFHYYMGFPIENFADFDQPGPVVALNKAMGKEKVQAMFAELDKCISNSHTAMYNHQPVLSYWKEGEKAPEGNFAMHYTFFHLGNASGEKIWQTAKAWKDLDVKSNTSSSYQIYWGGFGTDETTLLMIEWAPSHAELAAEMAKVAGERGEEGAELWAKTVPMVKGVEHYRGYYRNDLDLDAEEVEVAKK